MDFKSSLLAREAIQKAKSGRCKIAGTTITNAEWARVMDKPAENDDVVISTEVLSFNHAIKGGGGGGGGGDCTA